MAWEGMFLCALNAVEAPNCLPAAHPVQVSIRVALVCPRRGERGPNISNELPCGYLTDFQPVWLQVIFSKCFFQQKIFYLRLVINLKSILQHPDLSCCISSTYHRISSHLCIYFAVHTPGQEQLWVFFSTISLRGEIGKVQQVQAPVQCSVHSSLHQLKIQPKSYWFPGIFISVFHHRFSSTSLFKWISSLGKVISLFLCLDRRVCTPDF